MNQLLLNKKPSDATPEEWKTSWENSSYVLQPLADAIKAKLYETGRVKSTDFDIPNHYAKMAYEAGLAEMGQWILDLLPGGVNK